MLTRDEIAGWLEETSPQRLEQLWAMADATREAHVGSAVHLRGLVEISSHCCRTCHYCGLRGPNRSLTRYRLTAKEILEAARRALGAGFGTVVLQAGEDYLLDAEWVAERVLEIKRETSLAVTLSLGERPLDDLRRWRAAGADRYLLRFETSDPRLYGLLHPGFLGQAWPDRIDALRVLKQLGYEVGSGVMVGLPGQSLDSLADDLLRFRELDLDMIGIGPFLPHPQTPLAAAHPGSEEMVYKMIALTRLLCPEANIPSTTALATLNPVNGRELGLMRGANVLMPNLTPARYRPMYEIYPDKACITEPDTACIGCMPHRIRQLGRTVGVGLGGRRHAVARR